MTFGRPLELWLAAGAATGLWILLRRLEQSRRAAALNYSHLPFLIAAIRPRRIDAIFAGSSCMALFLLVAAGARPQLLAAARENVEVMLCLDASGSMGATDVAPSRAVAVRRAAENLIADLPARTPIGIVAFATSAQLVSPPGTGREALAREIDRMPRPAGGTAIGDALRLALQAFDGAERGAIVLVTDGVNTRGSSPTELVRKLASRHVRIYALGVGANASALVPGTAVGAAFDEGTLRALSAGTGGLYARATNAAELQSAFSKFASGLTMRPRSVDLALAFALAGGALTLATFVAGFGAGRFP